MYRDGTKEFLVESLRWHSWHTEPWQVRFGTQAYAQLRQLMTSSATVELLRTALMACGKADRHTQPIPSNP